MTIPHKAKSICKASSMAFPLRREKQQLIGCLCQKESSPQENGPGCIRRGHQVSSPDGETMRPSEDARLHSVASSSGQALRHGGQPHNAPGPGDADAVKPLEVSPRNGGLARFRGAKNDLDVLVLISSSA